MEIDKNKDFVLRDDRNFSSDDAKKALMDLKEYSMGKKSIDNKATENQEWWKLRHWDVISGESNEGKKAGHDVGSAWAVNSLLNKHADMMDSFPRPNILPREADDEEEAKALTSIVPIILEQNEYEEVYRTMGWDAAIDGAAITGVFWDPSKRGGMGDISINNVDVHNLFWKPGVKDIQDSDKVFHVTLEDADTVRAKFPEIADRIGAEADGTVTEYIHDDYVDTSNSVPIVEMYYKKTVMQPVEIDGVGEDGRPTKVEAMKVPRTILHYAIIVSGEIAFCSENEPGYEQGYYNHGKYPFVIRRMFPIKDSPWGFGYLDIMKHPQKDIDKLDQAIIKNAMMKARPRYWVRKNAAINKQDFMNWENEIVEVASGELNENIRQIDVDTVPASAQNHLERKIDELKETSGNRDFSQGSTQSGVTAASAIAALQEAGSKLSRDINKELYRGSREEYYLVIELIRQFYTEPRSFRVNDGQGGYSFKTYDNKNIISKEGYRDVMFDITVTAEKQSPFSRAAQNETAKELYGLGLFDPNNSVPALVCLEMMDFEGKDKVVQMVQDNSTFMQQLQAATDLLAQAAQYDPALAQTAMEQGLIQPQGAMPMQNGGAPMVDMKGTPEERAAGTKTDNSLATQARLRAAETAVPK